LCFTKEQVSLNETFTLEKLNGNKQNRDGYLCTHKVLASIKVQRIFNSHHLTQGDKENIGEKKKKSLATYNFCRKKPHIAMLSLSLYIPIPMCLLKIHAKMTVFAIYTVNCVLK